MLTLTSKQKKEVVEYCKKFVENNGAVRVGYAIEQVAGFRADKHVKVKVANILIQSGEYLKEPAVDKNYFDFNISKNPNYKEPTWIERHPIWFEIIKGLITAIFAIAVSVILSLSIFKQKLDEINKKQTIEKSIKK